MFCGVSLIVLASVVALANGAAGEAGKGLYRVVGLFGQVVGMVRSSYVEEVPGERLEIGAMNGLIGAADPYGAWVPDEVKAAVARVTARAVPPFGLVLGRRSSYPLVLGVMPGSPAEKAGLVPGELLERIGVEPVRARPLWLAQTLLDVAERTGRTVSLDVIDRQLGGKRAVMLAPGPVTVPAPLVEAREPGIVVVRMPVIDSLAAKKLAEALAALPGPAPATVIVDLRGGGLSGAQGAADVAAVLAGGSITIKLARRQGGDVEIKATAPPRAWTLLVCQDTTTAQAAELVALALKVRGARLVGTETYGDTGQREAFPSTGGEVWLATAWAVDAGGRRLIGAGIKPDEAVRLRITGDAVIERALELAHGEKTVARQAA